MQRTRHSTSGTRWRAGRRRPRPRTPSRGGSPGRPRIHEPEGRDAVGLTATATAFVGIDVSKATLDACLIRPRGQGRRQAFANDAAGHAGLIAWADRHAAGAAL